MTYFVNRVYNKQYEWSTSKGEKINGKLCEVTYTKKLTSNTMNSLIKYTIIFLNTAIRMVVIKIIEKVGHDNESEQMK